MRLPDNPRFRALIVGYPTTGKSGSLIALMKMGFKVYYHDFDNKSEVLQIGGPELRDQLVWLPYEDKIRPSLQNKDGGRLAAVSGEPKAYFNFMQSLEKGLYVAPDGTKEEIPALSAMGPGDIVVMDSMTEVINAIWRRYLFAVGRSSKRKQDWGAVVDELTFLLTMLNAQRLNCHSITIAHLMLTGADEMEEDPKNDRTDLVTYNNELKAARAELIGPRLFPKAVTKAQSENIAGKFPAVLPTEIDGTGRRIFNLTPRKELPVAVPALAKLPKTLPIETGLGDIFTAITGLKTPPQEKAE